MSEFEILTVRKLADTSEGERISVPLLAEVKLANGETVMVETGQRKLVNPATPGTDHEPWPSDGMTIVGNPDPPQWTTAGMRWASDAVREGWMRRIGERAVARPGGPLDAPWSTNHTFIHADKLIIEDKLRGDVVYRVVKQPDKYTANGEPVEAYEFTDDGSLAGSEVNWFYELELENNDG